MSAKNRYQGLTRRRETTTRQLNLTIMIFMPAPRHSKAYLKNRQALSIRTRILNQMKVCHHLGSRRIIQRNINQRCNLIVTECRHLDLNSQHHPSIIRITNCPTSTALVRQILTNSLANCHQITAGLDHIRSTLGLKMHYLHLHIPTVSSKPIKHSFLLRHKLSLQPVDL